MRVTRVLEYVQENTTMSIVTGLMTSTGSFSVVILMEQIYQKSEIAKWIKHKQNSIH